MQNKPFAFICAALLLLFTEVTFAAEKTEKVTIESVDAVEGTIKAVTKTGGRALTLEVLRKAKISLAGKDVKLSDLEAGQNATITYDPSLSVATKIEATGKASKKSEPKPVQVGTWPRKFVLDVVNLEEINSVSNEHHFWISQDGLTLYWSTWPSEDTAIWTAHRKDSKSFFQDKRRLFKGHSPVVSADGKEMIFGSLAPNQIMTASRESAEDEFSRPTVIREIETGEKEIPAPRWLSSDGLRLYLEKNGPDQSVSDVWMATREKLNSEWASPEQVKVNFEKGQGLRLGQSFLTDDERFMFVSVVKQGTPPRIGVLERKDVSEPFGKFWYLDLSDGKGPLPLYGMPRYSAATKELFVSSRFLFRSEELTKQRNSDIWVLKGFVFGD